MVVPPENCTHFSQSLKLAREVHKGRFDAVKRVILGCASDLAFRKIKWLMWEWRGENDLKVQVVHLDY